MTSLYKVYIATKYEYIYFQQTPPSFTSILNLLLYSEVLEIRIDAYAATETRPWPRRLLYQGKTKTCDILKEIHLHLAT